MFLIKRLIILFFVFSLVACENSSESQVVSEIPVKTHQDAPGTEMPATADALLLAENDPLEKSLTGMQSQAGIKILGTLRTGDLDVMVEHRVIRVLTVYGLGHYYIDKGQEKGLTYEWFKQFEDFVNKKYEKKHLRVHVVFIPVARDQLIPGLISGRGDIAAAALTITAERQALVDFSNPVSNELSELLVTGPTVAQIDTLDDLAGRQIYVRASSSYRSSLDALNQQFQARGLEAIDIVDAPEQLEDEDLLEMVNSGMLEWAVVDDYKARIWADIFESLKVREDLVLRTGGRIGIAFRKNSPLLTEVINDFIETHKQGTLQGNILINRYLKDFDWAKNALAADDLKRFKDVADIFLMYGEQYGVDYLMVAAQGYQESRLDQSARSSAGAIGIMQLLPTTAADENVGIPDITMPDANIHAGIKYLDFIRNRYFSDSEANKFNQTLFAFAAYNAGPARVRKLRVKAAEEGYDPNVWFDNVEVIAAKDIGNETVQYVANILKYYIAYSLTTQQQLERQQKRNDAGIQ